MNKFGYIKVAAAIPRVKVADCNYNAEQIISLIGKAAEQGVKVVVFPELSITSCSCGDLYRQGALLRKAENALEQIAEATEQLQTVAIVGLPIAINDSLYDCAAVVAQGEVLGIIPKTYIPNSGTMNDSRWFESAAKLDPTEISIAGEYVQVDKDLLFDIDGVRFGVEIGEDLCSPTPPSVEQALGGAQLIFNLTATAERAGNRSYTEQLVKQHSARTHSAYIYSSAGYGESSADAVYAGNAFIAENGTLLAASDRFEINEQLIVTDVDAELLDNERLRNSIFKCYNNDTLFTTIGISIDTEQEYAFDRKVEPMPFIPAADDCEQRCEEIFAIQTLGLAKRIEHTYSKSAVIGISGGLDSTLALLVAVKTFDKLGLDRKGIIGITMPGFGTTDRTYNNAITLIKELGVTLREIPIAAACRQHFADIGLPEGDRSVTYENSQARERTQILMDVANITNGIVIGTGDLSELALGWATYNGDQMSMYGVNGDIPKTLVRHLVLWAARNESNEKVRRALEDVVATPVSPELLPANEQGEIAQKTEDLVGPYELHDFILFHFIRNGFSPAKILFLAEKAFDNRYDKETIIKWIKTFFRRFFMQQFKRSALPDGPTVGSVSLASHSDWRMVADASSAVWMEECANLK